MGEFAILSNRRRAIVALAHSIVFLFIAGRQMLAGRPAPGIWVPSTVALGTWVLCGIFVVVTVILCWLWVLSRGWIERAYFGLCTLSAGSGLLRTAAGDQVFHAGIYLRVILLATAVVAGLIIVRMHSGRAPEFSADLV